MGRINSQHFWLEKSLFGSRFRTLRKSLKIGSLDVSQNQNGISSHFSSRNSSQTFCLLNWAPVDPQVEAVHHGLPDDHWQVLAVDNVLHLCSDDPARIIIILLID